MEKERREGCCGMVAAHVKAPIGADAVFVVCLPITFASVSP